MPSFLRIVSTICLATATEASFVFFPYSSNNGNVGHAIDAVTGFSAVGSLSSACAAALNATVDCDIKLKTLAIAQRYGGMNGTETDLYSKACGSLLATYHANVVSACGTTPIWPGAQNTQFGDAVWAWYNMSC